MAKHSKAERDEQIANLRKWIKKGQNVYTIVEHVAASGMSRTIRVLLIECNGKEQPYMTHPNHAVSVVLDLPRDKKREGVRISGCGMDMSFEIVYRLGSVLYNDGYSLKHQSL